MRRHELEEELSEAIKEEIAFLEETPSDRTVATTDGRRRHEVGNWVLYDFVLDQQFLVPDDSRVVAEIDNEQYIGQIVSIRGTMLLLALQRDLGLAIPRVDISIDATSVLRSILGRFEDPALSGQPDSLARAAFGLNEFTFSTQKAPTKVDLSQDKRDALARCVGSQLQIIWGPPGTGKTQLISALCEVLVERGESVLLASHTNIAVDEAILRAAGPGKPLHDTPAYRDGKLLRYGVSRHPDLARIEQLQAEGVAKRLGAQLEERLAEISVELQKNADATEEVAQVLADWERAREAEEFARSQEQVLEGEQAAVERRREEYRQTSHALEQALQELYRVLHPRGLARVFRKDPAPNRDTVRRTRQAMAAARDMLGVAEERQLAAHARATEARREAERLASFPSMPEEQALRLKEGLDREAQTLESEAVQVREELGGLVTLLVAEARFIAATLTRAATDENVCRRSFGTVITDEASMAPLPLVYLVALAAESRLILVGDFKQLPPIVQARGERATKAQEWLGRSIFDQAGISSLRLPDDRRHMRADLWRQHRMAAGIREFASRHFYGGRLRDAHTGDREYDVRRATREPAGGQVCLVDTSSLGAWSQRSPGNRPSKFNIYSAIVAVDLAETLVD